MLTYVVTTADGQTHVLSNADVFVADAQMGSMNEPYILQLSETTGIDLAHEALDIEKVLLYDESGRMIDSSDKPYTQAEINALNAGVYFQQMYLTNGQTRMQKMISNVR